MSLEPQNSGGKSGDRIVQENRLPGSPSTEWDINGQGDTTIQGFGHDISINCGETIFFKIKTDSTDYRIDIYRMGYYGGMGARLVDTIEPSRRTPAISTGRHQGSGDTPLRLRQLGGIRLLEIPFGRGVGRLFCPIGAAGFESRELARGQRARWSNGAANFIRARLRRTGVWALSQRTARAAGEPHLLHRARR